MDMQQNTKLGLNRTGRKMAPIEAKKSAEGAIRLTDPAEGDELSLAENRMRYMLEAEALGTIPLPANLKGVLSELHEKIMAGDHAFMDKLGERIAFERTGVRLYQALISKYEGSADKHLYPELDILRRFHQEEKDHFHMLSKIMEELGGDATAMTPSADMAGVASMGWLQVLTDPRTDFLQCLEIILQAELVDNDSWEILIELAEKLGQTQLATQFQAAKNEEDVHLESIRRWVIELNLNGSTDAPAIQIQ
jgi:rubrerythrin